MRRPAVTLVHVREGEPGLAPTEGRFIRGMRWMILRRGHASPCGDIGACESRARHCLAPTEGGLIRGTRWMILRRAHASPCGDIGACERGRGLPRPYGREIPQGHAV